MHVLLAQLPVELVSIVQYYLKQKQIIDNTQTLKQIVTLHYSNAEGSQKRSSPGRISLIISSISMGSYDSLFYIVIPESGVVKQECLELTCCKSKDRYKGNYIQCNELALVPVPIGRF